VVVVLLVGAAGCSSPFKSTPQLTASSTSADVAAVRANANAGDARAQFNLGYAYYLGRGVPQDDAQAVTWYRQAAEQGHAIAQYNLGVMYASCFYRVPQVVPTPLRIPCDTRQSLPAPFTLADDDRRLESGILV